jgi:hypothetical protein
MDLKVSECLHGTNARAVKPLPNESMSLKWAIKVLRRMADGFASLPVGDKSGCSVKRGLRGEQRERTDERGNRT